MTQRQNRAKSWKFTIETYDENDVKQLQTSMEEHAQWAILIKKPEYIQGYISYTDRVRFDAKMGKNPNIESSTFNDEKTMKKLREFASNDSKDGEILYSKNIKPPTEIITIDREKFYDWQEELVQLLEVPCNWDDRTIYWRHGDINIGKSQFSRWLCVHLGAYIIGGSHKHMLAQVQNAEAPIYIILLAYGDEKVSYRAIEQIKDGLFASAFGCDNNKMTIRNAPHILIIGNEPPDTEDRNYHPTKYNVKQIGSKTDKIYEPIKNPTIDEIEDDEFDDESPPPIPKKERRYIPKITCD